MAPQGSLYVNVSIRVGVGLGCVDPVLVVRSGGTAGVEAQKTFRSKYTRSSVADDRVAQYYDADASFPISAAAALQPKPLSKSSSKKHKSAPAPSPLDSTEVGIDVMSSEVRIGHVRVDYRNLVGQNAARDCWLPIERQSRTFSGGLRLGISVTPYPTPVPRDVQPGTPHGTPTEASGGDWIEVADTSAKQTWGGTTAKEAVALARSAAARIEADALAAAPPAQTYSAPPPPSPAPASAPPPAMDFRKVTPSPTETSTPREKPPRRRTPGPLDPFRPASDESFAEALNRARAEHETTMRKFDIARRPAAGMLSRDPLPTFHREKEGGLASCWACVRNLLPPGGFRSDEEPRRQEPPRWPAEDRHPGTFEV